MVNKVYVFRLHLFFLLSFLPLVPLSLLLLFLLLLGSKSSRFCRLHRERAVVGLEHGGNSTSPSHSYWAAAARPVPSPACRDLCWRPRPGSTPPAWTGWGRCPAMQTGAAAGGWSGGEGWAAGWCAGEPRGGKQRRPRGTARRSSRTRRMRSRRWRRSRGFAARGFAVHPLKVVEEAGWSRWGCQTWRRKQTLLWAEERATAAAPERARDSG